MNSIIVLILTFVSSIFFSVSSISFENVKNTTLLSNIYAYEGVENSTSTDKPLIITRTLTDADVKNKRPLVAKEIFNYTNIERVKAGLSPLVWNDTLAKMADEKVADMIKNKYFAHESPSGVNVSGLAKNFNYDYSLIGENLAMGDFLNSKDVVDGWMTSPGHRANILKPTYTEIGISSMAGLNDGSYIWFATQEFGRPSPKCVKPDPKMESVIQSSNSKMQMINTLLTEIKKQIEISLKSTSISSMKNVIDSYNSLVSLTNDFYKKLSSAIADYNNSVKLYNDCVQKENLLIKG